MKTIALKYTLLIAFLALLIGWFIGSMGGSDRGSENPAEKSETHSDDKEQMWTCSMHPQIRQNEPGDCPICGMDLVPVQEGVSADPNMFEMSESAAQLANIQTTKVDFTLPEKDIHLQGKVQVDERRIQTQIAQIPGRIERLYVSFTGEKIRKGQKLATIYSPALITAQKELMEARKTRDIQPELYQAARNKLKQWKLNDEQIEQMASSEEVQEEVVLYADKNGVVLEKKVMVGDHVQAGGILFTVADLSRVWVELDAYESDLPWLNKGDEITFTIRALPGETFAKPITFIDPVIDPQTRTASVRVEMNNRNGRLKPEMFADATCTAKLPIEEAQLTVPKSAVLWTGKRSVVYVAVPNAKKPTFSFREVVLGHDLGAHYIVKEGLDAGETVVTNGTFKVDAAAQLAGKKSMMNPSRGAATPGHQHGDISPGNVEMNDMAETQFTVHGNCSMCKARIEKAANQVPGVKHAVWNVDQKFILVHYDDQTTEPQTISKAIANAGHDTEFHQAEESTYNELPGCCQYSREGDTQPRFD